MKTILSASTVALIMSVAQSVATDFSPPSIFAPITPEIILDPPPVFPPESANGGIWARPIPDVSGQSHPGLVGGYDAGGGISGTIYIAPGGHGGGVSVNGIPLP